MLDSDLAMLYQVETKNLNKAATRNADRFPEDFRFKLTNEEYNNLRFQFGTSNEKQYITQVPLLKMQVKSVLVSQ